MVIRLTGEDFDEWANLYHAIPDLMTELASIDGWCARNWKEGSSQRKGWFHGVPKMLNKSHQELLAKKASDPAAEYWAEIKRGTIF